MSVEPSADVAGTEKEQDNAHSPPPPQSYIESAEEGELPPDEMAIIKEESIFF
jgi:hypothetical protein